MELHYTPYIIPALLSGVVAFGLAALAWRQRHIPATPQFGLMMLCALTWSVGYVLELFLVAPSLKVVAAKIQLSSIATLPLVWLFFVFVYTRREHWLKRRYLLPLVALWGTTVALVWTNEWHGFIWEDTAVTVTEPAVLHCSYGWWLNGGMIFSYILVLGSLLLLIDSVAHLPALYRGQSLAVLVGAVILVFGHVISVIGTSSVLTGQGWLALSFMLASPILAWAVLRYRLLDVMPVAYREVVESMHDAVITLDAEDCVIDLNPAAQQILNTATVKAVGRPIVELWPGYADLTGDGISTGEVSEVMLGGPGASNYFDLRISTLCSFNQPAGRLLVFRDVTANRKVNAALQYRVAFEEIVTAISTEFLDLSADQVDDGIQRALQTLCEFISADMGVVSLFGQDHARLVSSHVWDAETPVLPDTGLGITAIQVGWLVERFQEQEMLTVSRLSDLPPQTAELQADLEERGLKSAIAVPMYRHAALMGVLSFLSRQDGKAWPSDSFAMLKIVGEIFASTLTRKQTEDALQQRTRDLATFNQVGQALSAMLDMEQVIEMLLQRVVNLTDSMGSSVWLWEDDDRSYLVCKTAVHNGVADYLIDIRLEPGQGIAGWVAQHGESVVVGSAQADGRFAPQVDAQTGFQTGSLLAVPLKTRGEIIGVLEVVNKREGFYTEDERELVETLGASAAIAIDNARLFESLQQRNAELDVFAPNVAHDLKNPLSVVIGHTDMLLEYVDEMTPGELSQHVNAIGHNVRRMINITDELLLLSLVRRLEEVQVRPLDTAAIVENVQTRLSGMIAEYDAEVVIPQSWPDAEGYEPWIEQVWVNYFSNALKYGGSPPRVELGATVENGFVRFWVRDNGTGLTSEEQARLFQPFTRLDKVRVKGYGLGLSIVQRIVHRLGGEVGVESEPGEGSTFSFTVPRVLPAEGEI